jgi:choline dehydrogenase-like flavoprotein
MSEQQEHVEADFIVVGAGSAGCAVAARLSEDPATRVLLLEAGGEDRNRWIHIPLGFGKTFADPSVNWCYETEPDPVAADRRVFWPRGKVLGGSSSINGMVYIRGQAKDFDHWRQLGNTGWSFEDVLPYFKRSEHQTRGADAYHGAGGRSASRTWRSIQSARPSFRAQSSLAFGAMTISMARSRRVSAITRRRPAMGGAARLPSVICARQWCGPIFGS